MTNRLLLIAGLALFSFNAIADNAPKSQYATRLIEYMPAPGQFVNAKAWGMAKPQDIADGKDVPMSLGGFGGYCVFGFDQPITNDPHHPYGIDFQVKGNAFIANVRGVWTEPGGVQVMQDKNHNGIPDDGDWYELAGSEYWLDNSKRNITITYYNPQHNTYHNTVWKLNDGTTGSQLANQFHKQPYYPDPYYFGDGKSIRDSIQFTGTLIRSSLDKRAASYIEFYRNPAFGYADNHPNGDLTIPQNPYYPAEGQKVIKGDGFDLSWAVDKDGNYVDIDTVDFVKVYTAGNENAGWLGEWSTEALQVGITQPDSTWTPRDIYLNYAGITQLKVLKGQDVKYQGFLFKNGRRVDEGKQHWWVSDDNIATIDNNGLLHGKNDGTTWIYFSQMDTIPTDSFEVTVVELEDMIINTSGTNSKTSETEASVQEGEAIYINAEGIDNGPGELNNSSATRYQYDTYTFTSSDDNIASVDNGIVYGKKAGVADITVTSNSAPDIFKVLRVTVTPAPSLEIAQNPIKVSYKEPKGSIAANSLFTYGEDGTVYIDNVSASNNNSHAALDADSLTYSFEQGVYRTDTLTFSLQYAGKNDTVSLPIAYAPDAMPVTKRLLVAAADSIQSYDMQGKTIGNGIVIDGSNINAIRTRGAFAYILTGNNIVRYNVGDSKIEVKAPAKGNELAIASNKLYVKNDNNVTNSYYRTDLDTVPGKAAVDSSLFKTLVGDSLANAFTREGMTIADAVFDSSDSTYYILYAGNGKSVIGVYDNKLAKKDDLLSLGYEAKAIALMEATNVSEKPEVSTKDQPGTTLYEQGSNKSTININKNLFNKTDHNYAIYLRQEGSFLGEPETLANGNLRIANQSYNDRIDKDSVVSYTLEAIDSLDLGTKRTISLNVKPRVYQSLFVESDSTIYGNDTLRIPAGELFQYQNSNKRMLTFVTTLENNDNEGLISASIDNDTLVIAPSKTNNRMSGTAILKLAQNITFKQGKTEVKKTFYGSFKVTVDNTATGIGTISLEKENSNAYNLAGQRVGKTYKGVVISNGKKVLRK